MRTIITAITINQSRRHDRQGFDFVVASMIRGLERLAVVVRGFLVPVGPKHALVLCAHRAPAKAYHPATLCGRPWQAGLGTNMSLHLLPQGSNGHPAGTDGYSVG